MYPTIWVTGIGAVTPGGWTADETWHTVTAGKSCIRAIDRFETFPGSSRVGAMVPGRESMLPFDRSQSLEFGQAAAREAVAQAGIDPDERAVDLAIVATHGERRLAAGGAEAQIIGITELTDAVARSVGAHRSATVFGACAGSAQAIGAALAQLRAGEAGVVLAGGTDSLLREFDFFSFGSLYVMSTRDCPPEEASCPFDSRRDGFVLAEGAGFLVLETEDHAGARNARPLAILEGFGWAQNAYHMFAPPPDGLGPTAAMRDALADAHLTPRDIGWINAHGTSTRDNDTCETQAIRKVFGDAADGVPVSSSKSQLGHTMAACGTIEAVISVKALAADLIPPTSNLDDPDPACDLDYVPNEARPARLDHILSNSFGFGGHSASIVLGRPS